MATANLKYRIYVLILFLVFIIGTVGLITIEHFHPLDALYFIVATISTVGYGDVHPVTPYGKLLAIIIILAGVGCFVGVVANAIEYVVDQKERKLRNDKLNMMIEIFFSEVGIKLLKKFTAHDTAIDEIRPSFIVANTWSDRDFSRAGESLKLHPRTLDSRTIDLPDLNEFLTQHKTFMLSLLENPQMIEHDTFIPLLLAVFHLTDELFLREQLSDLPLSDYGHLSVDINRVYGSLILEWLGYVKHLKENHPHIFSLAVRTNPFDVKASVIVH
jgi:voltage-gated potassium channel